MDAEMAADVMNATRALDSLAQSVKTLNELLERIADRLDTLEAMADHLDGIESLSKVAACVDHDGYGKHALRTMGE